MTNFVELVRDFHKKMGHTAPSEPLLKIPALLASLRKDLIREEGLEVKRALHATREGPDLVALADGLADTIYVLVGTRVVYGGHKEKTYVENGNKKNFCKSSDPFLLIDWLFSFQLEKTLATLMSKHDDVGGSKHILSEIDYLTAMCVDIADYYHIPIHDVFQEVHRSNMDKLWEDGKPRYYDSGDKKGKVKKPPGWKPPDIESILKKHKKKTK